MADIEAVLEAHPEIDRPRIRAYVKEFAELLDSPELLVDLEALLKRVPGSRSRGQASQRPETPGGAKPRKRRR